MIQTRREFIRNLGVALASLVTSGCAVMAQPKATVPPTPMMTCYEPTIAPPPPPTVTCYKPTELPSTPTLSPGASQRWDALRACWLDLASPKLQSFEDTGFSRSLRQRHTDALKALVDGKELDAAVAAEIGIAFGQAIAHIQRQQATCYIALPSEFAPRQDLMTQAEALTEMAQRSAIDPATVARARAALEKDVAWLSQFQAGQKPGDLTAIQATPTEVEAASILVALLLGQQR